MYMVLHKKDLDLDYIINTHLHTHFYISQAHLYKWYEPTIYRGVYMSLSHSNMQMGLKAKAPHASGFYKSQTFTKSWMNNFAPQHSPPQS